MFSYKRIPNSSDFSLKSEQKVEFHYNWFDYLSAYSTSILVEKSTFPDKRTKFE